MTEAMGLLRSATLAASVLTERMLNLYSVSAVRPVTDAEVVSLVLLATSVQPEPAAAHGSGSAGGVV